MDRKNNHMKEKLIAQGAEAHIFKNKNTIIKQRVVKGYRLPELDTKLRTQRTRREAKIIGKLANTINVPKITNVTSDTIIMSEIKGKKLADCLDKQKDQRAIAQQIGHSIAKLHDAGIIHGDLTTSNMIFNNSNKRIYLIDFGLGFHSDRVEDKAVDLHVLKEALKARHPNVHDKVSSFIIASYKKTSKQANLVLKQLEKVERRGRYKPQY